MFLEILQRYCKLVVLGTLEMPAYPSQSLQSNCWKFSCSSAGKKSVSYLMLFWRYCKDKQTSYSRYFGHAWLHIPKMKVSTCRRRRCLSACKKYTSSLTSFSRYYILKNCAIWFANSILAHNSRIRILPDMGQVIKYQ